MEQVQEKHQEVQEMVEVEEVETEEIHHKEQEKGLVEKKEVVKSKINKVKNSIMTKEEIPTNKRQRCEIYSRVVGYLRPTSQWNVGKREEFKDRKEFNVKNDTKR